MNPARKPHIRLLPVAKTEAPGRESPVDAARRRHGKPFATEAGNTHKPRETPLLTAWLANRVKDTQ
jgi:hypothetical protein